MTVRRKPGPPAAAPAGLSDASVGGGITVMVNVNAFVGPPPGGGVKTVTGTVPPAAMSLAAIFADSWLLATKVVGRSLPPQRTTDADTKFEPVTVKVKSGPPAAFVVGDIEVSVGAGFVVKSIFMGPVR
jgi:hypothetical protein